LPALQILLKVVELFFKGLTAFGKAALTISNVFKQLGPLGKVAGALVNVAALYSLFTLATRFFKVLGNMFGKKMKDNMNINAANVYVNGSPVGGGPMGRGGPAPSPNMPMYGRGGAAGYMSLRQQLQSGGRYAMARGRGLLASGRGFFRGSGGMLAGGAAMMGGSWLSGRGDEAGGYNTAGGSAMKTAGMAGQVLGGAKMMGAGSSLMAPLAIGVGAYGAGSYIGGKFKDDSLKSKGMSAGASALAGAAIGATIGSFVPVIGTGVGAALGAAIGGITGYFKAGKERKATREAAEGILDAYSTSIDEAIAGGNVDDLLAARDKMIADRAKLINTNGDPAYAAKAVAKYDAEFEKLNTQIDNYTKNVGISDKYFGVGAESLNKMATAAGVDLKERMLNFREVLNLVGKTAEEKARLIKQAWANIGSFAVSEAMSYFDKKAQAKEQGKMLNATQARILTGDTSEATSDQYLKQMLDYNVSKFGDVGGITNAYATLEKQLTTGSLKDISDTQKEYLRNELKNAGATPEGLLKNVDSTELATLLGGNTALDQFKKSDGTLDATRIMSMITSKMTGPNADPAFLANLIEAQQSADPTINAIQTSALLNTGALTPAMLGATATMSPAERMARGMTGVPPASAPQTNVVNTTVNASVLDRGTIRQIEEAIAKALREQKERGTTTTQTVRNS
jgi:hypothetical protein